MLDGTLYYTQELEKLLAAGAFQIDDREPETGATGFFKAVACRLYRVAEWFLDHGANPWLAPPLVGTDGRRNYLTTSVVQLLMNGTEDIELLKRVLEWNPAISRQHCRTHTCEYTFMSLIDFLLFHISPIYRPMESRVKKLMLLLEYGAGELMSDRAYEILMRAYFEKEDENLLPVMGKILWLIWKEDLCALRIQRAWRQRRRVRAATTLQRRLRLHIWHPDHTWGNGLTTVERLFG